MSAEPAILRIGERRASVTTAAPVASGSLPAMTHPASQPLGAGPGAVASAAAPFHPRLRVSEAELWSGYSGGPAPLSEPCACGSVIVCISGEIPLGVAAHNATPEHRAWQAAGGMGEGPSFEVPVRRRWAP